MASTHSSYSSPSEAKLAAKYLNETSQLNAYTSLLKRFIPFIGDCCTQGDLILRKPSKRKEINSFYQSLSYELVGCKEEYTAFETESFSEKQYYVSGYSGRVTSNGSIDATEQVGTYDIKRGKVKESHEKKTAIIERWVKIVPEGTREAYLKKEERFLTVARPYFQAKSFSSTSGKPNGLLALLHTLLMVLSLALPVLVSNFVNLLLPTATYFNFQLLPHIIAAGCYASSLIFYFIFLFPFRDKRVIVDIRDSRYFNFLWISPVFFIADAVLSVLLTKIQEGRWFYCLNAVGWVLDFCGIVLLLVTLFYLVTMHHYRVIKRSHELRTCFAEKSHVKAADAELASFADSKSAAFIKKAAAAANLSLLDQFTKFSNFDAGRDPFSDDFAERSDEGYGITIPMQTKACILAALAAMKKEVGEAPAPKKTVRRSKKKTAPAEEPAVADVQAALEEANSGKSE